MDERLANPTLPNTTPEPGPRAQAGGPAGGLVMLCDVDFGFPDATRTHTVEVARGFANLGFDVDLVARGPDQHIDGVRYRSARGGEHQLFQRLLTLNMLTFGLLWRRRSTARRFYVRDKWACVPSMAFARALGYRVVTQVDAVHFGPGIPAARGYVKRLLTIVMGRLSHGILAVTPELKRLLIESAMVPADRITVIGNGVDIDFFAPTSRAEAIERCGLDPGCRYAIFCGGFHAWTDFDLMLEGFAAVASAQPEARLLMVGDGPERDRIERRIAELGLRSKVIMTGAVHERRQVRDYLGAATATLLLYRAEIVARTSASPVKLNEYLASGRAVVAVEISGVRSMVEGSGAGIIVNGDASTVSDALLRLLGDPEAADEMGARGRRFAEQQLSWRRVVQRTLPLFGI